MMKVPVPEHVRALRPYIPGKPIEEVQRELGLTDVIKLASNENPLGPPPRAVEAIARAAAGVTLYPEGDAPTLRAAVSKHVGMPPECLVFGNGSDEIIHLLAMTFLEPGDEVVQGDPSFAMYEIYTAQCNGRSVKVPLKDQVHDLDAMLEAITPRTRIVFVANPNNPTGTYIGRHAIERFVDRLPDNVLLVMDEAYYEYVEDSDRPDLRPLIRDGRDVIILRTFSKAYGLAGLRVGYGITTPEIAAVLNKVRSPFNVNSLAQAAATAALQDADHIRKSVALNTEGRHYYEREFDRLGLPYVPSQANFILVDVGRNSRTVFEALQRLGVIIRPGAGLGLPQYIRVSIGTAEQNQRFIAALEKVLAEVPREGA
jgi:histidinol-phosphate aminotransferase